MNDHENSNHAHASHRMRARVITVSDRSARGERLDRSGPRAAELLTAAGFDVDSALVPDGVESVQQALAEGIRSGAKLVVTTGGTGVGPRDLTPEGTRSFIARELPGIAEMLRREGSLHNRMAVISRGIAGITGDEFPSLIVNLPGSLAAVEEGLAVLTPIVGHILDQVRGGDH